VSTVRTYTAYGEVDTETATVSSATELAFDYGYDAQGRIERIAESGHPTRSTSYVDPTLRPPTSPARPCAG
jgi:hypothetical protein